MERFRAPFSLEVINLQLNLFNIKEDYIELLREYDDKVLYNKGQKRPYVGIVLKVYSNKFFVPLSSPKPKHISLPNNTDIFKIAGGELGILNFNNMIPVPQKALLPISIDEQSDNKYKILLAKQLKYLRANVQEIKEKAKMVYDIYQNPLGKSQKSLAWRCCNFNKLMFARAKYE